MSLSNPTNNLKNPAVLFIEWDGGTGELSTYDKELKERKVFDLPFKFVVLDELTSIKGFDKNLKSFLYSNEIRNTKTDTLHVRSFKGGLSIKGFYQEIKAEIVGHGAKFGKSVYAATIIEGKLQLVGIQLHASGFSGWYDFTKKRSTIYGIGITCSGKIAKKNGSVDYFDPVFEQCDIKPETIMAATELDKTLQTYLETYLSRKPDTVDNSAEVREQEEVPMYIPDDAYNDMHPDDQPPEDFFADSQGEEIEVPF